MEKYVKLNKIIIINNFFQLYIIININFPKYKNIYADKTIAKKLFKSFYTKFIIFDKI